MRIRQYVYFALTSETMTAAEMATAIGLEPDAVGVRGSRPPDPPVPASHSWEIRCDEHGLAVDEQIERVLDRLRPHADRIGRLVADRDLGAVLQILRDFDADDGEVEVLDGTTLSDGTVLTKVPGQHQLLGWHLDADSISLLIAMGADIDCDEYGG